MSQWLKGLTSRELADEHCITQKTVLRWLYEYMALLFNYLCKRVQKYTSRLHVDELFLKMLGTFYYLWDALCAETRFLFLFLSAFRDALAAQQLLEHPPRANNILWFCRFVTTLTLNL
ncbi:MAG: DDE-type integrase/transposase/recombinase [Candidatus Diapherotrites archaeon]|nr:DDE-type integrase/transposase/recombinase [Candidatus Diapherotrites archaeon]